jgi:hypothetical protein
VRGGFRIDFKWANRQPAQLVIHSTGGTACRVRSRDKVVTFAMQPGQTRILGPDLRTVE